MALNGKILEEVKSFEYLEATIVANLEVKLDMRNKVNERCKFWDGIKKDYEK